MIRISCDFTRSRGNDFFGFTEINLELRLSQFSLDCVMLPRFIDSTSREVIRWTDIDSFDSAAVKI